VLLYIFSPHIVYGFCVLIYLQHCQELMKSVGSCGSLSLLFNEVEDGLALCKWLSKEYDCTHCHFNFKFITAEVSLQLQRYGCRVLHPWSPESCSWNPNFTADKIRRLQCNHMAFSIMVSIFQKSKTVYRKCYGNIVPFLCSSSG
jgi:hypothetical protein